MKTTDKFPSIRTTGIGSLPHHNVDTALEFSFKLGIPFLPQIPIRNPWEYMIPQALDGLAGIQVDREGVVNLNLEIWKSQSHILEKRLRAAFSNSEQDDIFEAFEPSAPTSSCWQPFLWELQERRLQIAKIQIAGPMTSQWAIRVQEGSAIDHYPELTTQIFKLVLARALAMVKRMVSFGIHPILFLDEPGIYAFSTQNPKHVLCLQELKLMIQTLQKAGATVGLHCCSNADWESLCHLGLDILSVDMTLSLDSLFSNLSPIQSFIQNGGRFSLGIIPTADPSLLNTLEPKTYVQNFRKSLSRYFSSSPDLLSKLLQEALYTPTCGLAFQSTSDVETVLEKLTQVYAIALF